MKNYFIPGILVLLLAGVLFAASQGNEGLAQASETAPEGNASAAVAAADDINMLYVCQTPHCTYNTIQAAVDAAAPGQEILVARGNYLELTARPVENWGVTATVTSTLHLTKVVKIYGGWNSDFTERDPEAYVTQLAPPEGNGRCAFIAADAVIDGVKCSGGHASDNNGPPGIQGNGGGILVWGASPTLRDINIEMPSADYGGGIYLYASEARLENLNIRGGIATYQGGGLYLAYSSPRVDGLVLIGNTAPEGGGAYLYHSSGSTFDSLIAQSNMGEWGGGLYLNTSNDVAIEDCTVENNTASGEGGGMYVSNSRRLAMDRCVIKRNLSYNNGGGMYITSDSNAELINVAGLANSAGWGSYLYVISSTSMLLHNNVISNSGSAVWVTGEGIALLGNAIIANNEVGVYVDNGVAAIEHGVWFSNTMDHQGAQLEPGGNWFEDPGLSADGIHLTGVMTPAIDTGKDYVVNDDIDGEIRPTGSAPDIGVDEYGGELPCAAITVAKIISGPTEPVISGTLFSVTGVFTQSGPSRPVTITWTPMEFVVGGQGTLQAWFKIDVVYNDHPVILQVANNCGDAGSDEWLVEVIEEPEPPVCTPVTEVELKTPTLIFTGTTYYLQASAQPFSATGDFTFTWSTPGNTYGETAVHSMGSFMISDLEVRYDTPGPKSVSVMVEGGCEEQDVWPVSFATINVAAERHELNLPFVLKNYSGCQGTLCLEK
ncbi:MAG: right-handed parallel beta-helix repeat-containing protein [Candidatus Woesebacteria bacterium]|jgi:hypothetical protein